VGVQVPLSAPNISMGHPEKDGPFCVWTASVFATVSHAMIPAYGGAILWGRHDLPTGQGLVRFLLG
jgi:hypothetical protein